MEAVRAHPFMARLARTLLSLVFLVSGLTKFMDLDKTAALITSSTGLPFADVLAPLVGVFEVGAALMLLFAFQERVAAAALALYLVLVNLLVHDFWAMSGTDALTQRMQFMKNLAIMGGLLAVYSEVPFRAVERERRTPADYAPRTPIRVP